MWSDCVGKKAVEIRLLPQLDLSTSFVSAQSELWKRKVGHKADREFGWQQHLAKCGLSCMPVEAEQGAWSVLCSCQASAAGRSQNGGSVTAEVLCNCAPCHWRKWDDNCIQKDYSSF